MTILETNKKLQAEYDALLAKQSVMEAELKAATEKITALVPSVELTATNVALTELNIKTVAELEAVKKENAELQVKISDYETSTNELVDRKLAEKVCGSAALTQGKPLGNMGEQKITENSRVKYEVIVDRRQQV